MFALYYKSVTTLSPKTWQAVYTGVLFGIALVAVLFLAQPAHAQTVVFSDTFDAGYEKWEPTRDLGDFWSIHNEQLHGYIPMGFTISELVPKDIYWNPEWKNIRYELDFLALSGGDKNISFHFEDLYNWYEVHFTHGGMEILRLQNGTVPWVAHGSTTLQNNVVYRIALELIKGQISLYIDDELVFDDVDPTFNNNHGKIGLKVGTGSIAPTHISIDNVRVILLDSDNRLGVSNVSQLDPQWANTEYDTALRWHPNDPTISAWGCALSSMVMILDFHGISQFADGTPITPETLNFWLNTQHDGYIGNGLLNWLAVTRLTNQLSQIYQTPSLEFSLATNDIAQTLVSEIQTALRPAIVNIPGHFLVADGVVPDTQNPDFYIQDPYYTYDQLSEHSVQPTSLRLFTPSFTDLSYFLFSAEDNATTQLALSQSNTPISLESVQSYLSSSNQSNPGTTEKTLLSYLQKPESGQYQLTLEGAWAEPYEISVFTYSSTGESTVHKLAGIHASTPTTYLLTFDKETGVSQIQLQNKVSSLKLDLRYLFDNQEITSHFVWYELTRLVAFTELYTNQKAKLKIELLEYLSESSDFVSLAAQSYLQTQIGQL